MKQIVHFILILIAAILWTLGCIGYALALGITLLASIIHDKSVYDNCWSYATPKWIRYGGYLLIRPADGQRFLKWLPVLHVAWVKNIDPACVEVEQYAPIDRKSGIFLPWHVFYYKGEIKKTETPHPSSKTDWVNL